MYAELLRIKRYREQLAVQAVRRAQQQIDQQHLLVRQKRQEVIDFREQRLREEAQRFEDVRNQLILVKDIDEMNNFIARLREREALLEQGVLEEEKRLEEMRRKLEAARQHHQATVRECEKFDQLAAVQRAADEREMVMREESELEESASATHQMNQRSL